MPSPNRYLQRLALKRLWLHPVRSLVCVAAIAAGVALFIAVRSIGRASLQSFSDTLGALSGKVDLVVSAGELGFSAQIAEWVEALPEVDTVNGVIETRGWIAGRTEPLTVVGLDLLNQKGERRGGKEALVEDSLEFIAQPDSVLVPGAMARKIGLQLGSRFKLRTPRGAVELTVRGLLESDRFANAYGGGFLILDLEAARLHFGRPEKLDRLDIRAAENTDIETLAAKIRERVGAGLSVIQPEKSTGANERLLSTFGLMLSLQSLLALLAGAFLVFNLMSIAASERRRETGMIRAIGASREAVTSLFLLEVLPLGMVGSALGILGGIQLSGFMVSWIGSGISRDLVQTPEFVRSIPAMDSLIGCIMGLMTSVLGGVLPALRASRTSPLEAIAPESIDSSLGRGLFKNSGRTGIALILASFPVMGIGWFSGIMPIEMGSHFLILAGFVLWTPSLVSIIAGWLSRMSGKGGVLLKMAFEQMIRNPRRTGSASASLVIGLVLVLVVASAGLSFERSVQSWYSRQFRDDFLISARGELAGYAMPPLHESVVDQLKTIPGVRRVHAMRFVRTKLEGRQIAIKAYDRAGPKASDQTQLMFVDGDPDAAVRRLFSLTEQSILVSENFRSTFGKTVGDTVSLFTPQGPRVYLIAGIIIDHGSTSGVVVFGRPLFRRDFLDRLVTIVSVVASDPTAIAALRATIQSSLSDHDLQILSQADIRGEISRMFRDGLAYTRSIEFVALLIAFLGLFSHFLMSVAERTREIGVMRAVGMSRVQLSAILLAEAGLLGAIAGSAALLISAGISVVWVKLTLSQAWGWNLEFHYPLGFAVLALAGAILIPVVSVLFAVVRTSRMTITEALAYK